MQPMFFTEYKYGKSQSIWAESSENWDEAHPSWKIIGQSPRRILRRDFDSDFDSGEVFLRSSIEHIFKTDKMYYLACFSSGRTCLTSSYKSYEPGTYVILEADRGEDCALLKERIYNIDHQVLEPKAIIRAATPGDIEILESRRNQEIKALEKCLALVKEKSLLMEITGCEFQWDMKKITFYFKSCKRVDFRELVKDLFKYFKIRIWMSMENRKEFDSK